MRRFLIPVLIIAFLSGCQTPEDALTNSDPIVINGATAGAIAGDMASRLAEQIGPAGTTTIKMDTDTSDYAVALEAALKGWGYAVIVDGKAGKDQKPVELAWSIGQLQRPGSGASDSAIDRACPRLYPLRRRCHARKSIVDHAQKLTGGDGGSIFATG